MSNLMLNFLPKGKPCLLTRMHAPNSTHPRAAAELYWSSPAMKLRHAPWLTFVSPPLGNRSIMSPDTVSSLFPDRPIRPLPRRRLRERLSPQGNQSAETPSPSGVNDVPLSCHRPDTARHTRTNINAVGEETQEPRSSNDIHSERSNTLTSAALASKQHGPSSPRFSEERTDGKLSDNFGNIIRPKTSDIIQTSTNELPITGHEQRKATNNKKKRKIPSANEVTARSSQFASNEFILGLRPGSAADDTSEGTISNNSAAEPVLRHNEGISGSGRGGVSISGPGRGRLSRAGNQRCPLRTLSDANSSWPVRSLKPDSNQSTIGKSIIESFQPVMMPNMGHVLGHC